MTTLLHRSTTMSGSHSHDRKPTRSHSRLRRTLAVLLAVALGIVTTRQWVYFTAVLEAEETALMYASIYGNASRWHQSTLITDLLSQLIPNAGFKGKPSACIALPRNRLDDVMAKRLLDIRNLTSIQLYPPDPNFTGLDFSATSRSFVTSLRELFLPLSDESIRALEERFPGLDIQVYEHSDPVAQGDVTSPPLECGRMKRLQEPCTLTHTSR